MTLRRSLADELIRRHPERAAAVLELAGVEEAVRQLSKGSVADCAPVLRRMSPLYAASVLEGLDAERIGKLVQKLPIDVAARLVRRIAPERRDEALASVPKGLARGLRSVMRFEEGSAGALMDPQVLALPESMTARDALDRVRETPETARYNLYVVDAEHRLVGVVNLRELLLARPTARLADFMVRDPERLQAADDRTRLVSHPGWRGVHSLPVVDEQGAYLGAVRYRMLRALEEELFAGRQADSDARQALGQLFAAGAGGLIDALSSTQPPGRDG